MFSHDEYTALRNAAGLLDRRSRGRIQLTGSDRRDYLQGLLTNDIVALSAGNGCYAALLTPQGRMISDMRVSELGDMVLIDLPSSVADGVRQHLADFIFTEDAEVKDVRDSLGQLGLYGPKASDVLASVLTRATAEDEAGERRDRLERMPLNTNARWLSGSALVFVVRSDDYGLPGFELVIDAGDTDRLAAALRTSGAVSVGPDTVEVTRVEAGRPEFGVDMDEHTIPLEAGIEDRAISLTKGCYVGQEIIIRVLHRGHGRVARRLVGFVGDPDDGPVHRGDRLVADGKDVGTVTSGVVSPALKRPIGLGYVHRDHADAGNVLRIAGQIETDVRAVTVVTVPFTHPAAG
jgi:tRNA-modifying protein YgfZ